MKQQVIVVHGGTTFSTYEDYVNYLRTRDVAVDNFKSRSDWKGHLQTALGEDFEVLMPSMPNKTNARYAEWKIWFERMIPFLKDDVILVGHSMGGIFLAKYLSEEQFPKKIRAVFLVAAPCRATHGENLSDFVLEGTLEKFKAQAGAVYIYHSKDDVVVPFSDAEEYAKVLTEAHVRVFDDRGHFNSEQFPEIVEDINNVSH